MATTALSYMKNVAKSFGYAFQDNFNEMNPTVSALFRETRDLKEDLYQSIDNFKAKIANPDSSIRSEIQDTTKELWANLNSDLRTGKWYNKARKEKASDAAMSAMFGIDFDDFGDFDADFDDVDSDLDEQASIQEDATKAMTQAMDIVGGKTAAAISTATVNSANYIVQSSRMNTKALYNTMNVGFTQVSTGLAAVNANIGTLVKLGEPLTKHMQNSSVFFARTNEYQEKSLKLLEQIAQNTAPKNIKKGVTATKMTMNDMFTSEGIIDFNALKQYVKQSGSGTFGLMKSMFDMFGGVKGMTGEAVASPLAVILPMLTGQLFNVKGTRTGKSMRDAMKEFNQALSGMFAGGVARLQDTKFDNGIIGTIGKMLQGILPKSGVNNKFNPKDYEKGPMDWDGKARIALMQVIPTQLGKILAALTGKEEMRFDYNTGRWIRISGIAQARQTRINNAGIEAGGDLLRDLRASVENSGMSNATKKGYNRELTAFFAQLVREDNTDFLHILDEDFNLEKYRNSISPAVFQDMQRRLRELRRQRPGRYAQLSRNMYSARSRYGRNSMDADSLEVQLDNGSIGAGASGVTNNKKKSERQVYNEWIRRPENRSLRRVVSFDDWRRNPMYHLGNMYQEPMYTAPTNAGMSVLNQVDEYGKNHLFYLNGIYQYTGYIAKNLKYLVPGRSGKNNRGGRITLEPAPVVQLSRSTIEQVGREQIELATTEDQMAADIAANAQEELNFNSANPNIDQLPRDLKEYYYARQAGTVEKDTEKERAVNQALRSIQFHATTGSAINKAWRKVADKSKFIQDTEATLGVTSDEVSAVLSTVTESLNNLIYGKDERTGVSLMDSVKTGVANIFDELTLHIKDYIPEPIKKFFSALWDSNFVKDIRQQTKKTLKSMFGWFFSGKEEREQRQAAQEWQDSMDWNGPGFNSGEGGYGSGLRRYISRENRIAKNFQHNRRYLGVGGGASVAAQPQPQRADFRENAREYHSNAAPSRDEDADEDSDSHHIETNQEIARRTVNKAANKVANKIISGLTSLIGSEKPEEERKKIRKNIEGLMGDVAGAKGALGAGALVGAGTSLLTGAFLGPIAGAAIGASVGFVVKSKTAQNILFGEEVEDEDGNVSRAGGVLGKKVSNFIYDHVPSMAKGAGFGAAGGLLLGSPVLGAIVGSSIGFVTSSERAKNVIFGEIGEDGKRKGGMISKEMQEKVKKAFPRMAGGALLGAVAGPFGLAGNILLGSALGFASTTDRWKKFMFGVDENGEINKKMGQGGLTGKIKKDLFDPILGIFNKLGDRMRSDFKALTVSIAKRIRRFILKRAGGAIANRFKKSRVGRAIGGVVGGVGKLGWNILTGPGRLINKGLERGNLARGYTIGNMTAAERIAQRKENSFYKLPWMQAKNARSNAVDELIAANQERLPEIQEALQNAIDPSKVRDQKMIAGKRKLHTEIEGITDKVLGNADAAGEAGQLYNKFLREFNAKAATGKYSGKELYKMLSEKGKYKELFASGAQFLDENTVSKLVQLADQQHKNASFEGAAKESQDKLVEMIKNAGLEGQLLDENGKLKLKDKHLIRALEQAGIDLNAKQAADAAKEAEENEKNEKVKTKSIIDTIPKGINNIVDILSTGIDDIITAITAKDPDEIKDLKERRAARNGTEEEGSQDQNKTEDEKAEEEMTEELEEGEETEGGTKKKGIVRKVLGTTGKIVKKVGKGAFKVVKTIGKGIGTGIKMLFGGGASGLFGSDSEEEQSADLENDAGGEDSTVRGQYGDIQDNNASTKVRKEKEQKSTFFKAIGKLPVIGGGINKLVGIAENIQAKIAGAQEGKKESLLSKLFKLLGIVGGGLLSIFTGGFKGVSSIIGSIFGGTGLGGAIIKGIAAVASSPVGIAGLLAAGGALAYKFREPIYNFISNFIVPPIRDAIKNSSIYKFIKSFLGIKDEEYISPKETLSQAKEISAVNDTYKQLRGETVRKGKEAINDSTFGKAVGAVTDKVSSALGMDDGSFVYKTVSDKEVAKLYFKNGKVPSYIPDDTPVYIMDEYTNYRMHYSLEDTEETWNSYREFVEANGNSSLHSKTYGSDSSVKSALDEYDKNRTRQINEAGKSVTNLTSAFTDAFNPASETFDPARGVSQIASSLYGGSDAELSAGASKIKDTSGNRFGKLANALQSNFSDALGMNSITNDIVSDSTKKIAYMQKYTLNGETDRIWGLNINVDRSEIAGSVFGTMFDLSKTIYAMLSVMTGVLTPMQATIAGVNSGLEYITGAKINKTGSSGSDSSIKVSGAVQSAASSKSNSFVSKIKGAFSKIANGFKKLFGGGSSGLLRKRRPIFGYGAGASGLYPLFGIGGGRVAKDTTGQDTVVSASKTKSTDTSSANLDYSGNDTSHPWEDQIWSYLKSMGFSDEAAAGIMGNMRAEAGPQMVPQIVDDQLWNRVQENADSLKDKYTGYGINVTDRRTFDKDYTIAVDDGTISKTEFRRPRGGDYYQYGYGMTQFTYPPFKDQLWDMAKDKKSSIGNLGVQLDTLMGQLKETGVWEDAMKSGATVYDITKSVLEKYENPGDSATNSTIEGRAPFAEEFYNKYKGKDPKTLPVYGKAGKAGGNKSGSSSSSSDSGSSNKSKSGSDSSGSDFVAAKDVEGTLLDKIKQAFYNGFMALFSGQDPDKYYNRSSSSSGSKGSSSSSSSSNSSSSGDKVSNENAGENPFADQDKQPVDYMRSWIGKCVYSQSGPRDPHKGSSDCSSTVQHAILDANGPDIGGWTNPQSLNEDTMTIVKRDTGGIGESDIKLAPNDVLLYQCNYSLNNDNYPYGIGHAAMYAGDGKMIEQTNKHDGTKGTYESDMRYNKLVQVSRVKPSAIKGGGGASGFVSQLDSRYSNIRVGGKSMQDNGCGPASAVMALGSMGRGASMKSAANLANKYQTTGGTDAAYFRDIFSRNGVGSSYVMGQGVKQAVASGNPVVLMGQDRSNTSKARSPFGPNNHYVVAKGMDANGNVNIADPESGGVHKYSSKILNNVKVGVAATGSGLLRRRGKKPWWFGIGAGKSNKGTNTDQENESTTDSTESNDTSSSTATDNGDTKKVIWDFLRDKVGLSEAGTAGVMGCWQEESHNSPFRVEGDYLSDYPGYESVFSNAPDSLDDYTRNYLFGKYANSGVNINQSAYIMDGKYSGKYAPGLGLGQWTGPRTSHLLEYTDDKGEDWKTLKGQLDFFVNGPNEFMSNASYDYLKNATDVYDAVGNFYKNFESGGLTIPSGDPRLSHGKEIYDKYKGSDVTTDLSTYADAEGSSDSGSSGSSGDGDSGGDGSSESKQEMTLLQKILAIFTNAFTALLSGKAYEGTDFGDGNSGSSGGSDSSSSGKGGKSRDALLKLAADEIGTHEDPPSSNKVKYNDWFWGEGTSGSSYPWCAAFVSWLFDQTYGDKAKDVMRGDKSASVAAINAYYDAANATKQEPEPGDIIFYGSRHTGIVESVDKDNKSWIGIEGNTSGSDQANGGEVARKEARYYSGSNKYSGLTGFGRPNWDAGGAADDEDEEDEDKKKKSSEDEDENTNETAVNGSSDNESDSDEGASGSGLNRSYTKYRYKPSKAGRKVLMDMSGRFSGGESSILNEALKGAKKFSIDNTSTKTSSISVGSSSSKSSSSKTSGISKETAAMLKVIITLVEKLVSNTEKVENIYTVLEEYCKNSGNSELTDAVSTLGAGASGTKRRRSSYIPKDNQTDLTLDSLSDLKNICDRILIG